MTLEGNDLAKYEFLMELAMQVFSQNQVIATNLVHCAKRLKELSDGN